MQRLRNVAFMIWIVALVLGFKARVLAADGPAYNCYDSGGGNLTCTFTNGSGERSCSDMEGVCQSFCNNGINLYVYTSCTEDGGGANHGYCVCTNGGGGGGGGCGSWNCGSCYQQWWGCGSSCECCGGLMCIDYLCQTP